jgi:hypothetical protein|tara:strand:- start:486 stop:914 length:429 start_codon:yes stop_codon:yes gene_type:complete
MDKKTIMKMNDSWKNFRLTESAKLFQSGAQHGFDLTDFKPGGFKRFLKALNIPAVSKGSSSGASWSNGKNYYWRNKDIIIITANNPITGQYYAPDRRDAEKNYASYVGIETKDPKDMDKVVKLFKQNTSYRKGESKGRRDFV